MPWNINNLLLPSFCLRMEQLFKDLAWNLPSKQARRKKTQTHFRYSQSLFDLPPLVSKFSGEKLLFLLFTQSIVFSLLSLVMFLHLNVYIIVLLTIKCLKFFIMLILFFFNLTSTQNQSQGHDYVVSQDMVLNIKVIVVGILFPNAFESLIMSHSGNTKCSQPYLPSK